MSSQTFIGGIFILLLITNVFSTKSPKTNVDTEIRKDTAKNAVNYIKTPFTFIGNKLKGAGEYLNNTKTACNLKDKLTSDENYLRALRQDFEDLDRYNKVINRNEDNQHALIYMINTWNIRDQQEVEEELSYYQNNILGKGLTEQGKMWLKTNDWVKIYQQNFDAEFFEVRVGGQDFMSKHEDDVYLKRADLARLKNYRYLTLNGDWGKYISDDVVLEEVKMIKHAKMCCFISNLCQRGPTEEELLQKRIGGKKYKKVKQSRYPEYFKV